MQVKISITGVGGPNNLMVALREPTIEAAGTMMKHPKIKLLVVTGGPGVVKAAMQSGKKVVAAGPGNVDKWLRANGPVSSDIDAFIEKIPFEETRGYVKRVLRSYAAYKMLHG